MAGWLHGVFVGDWLFVFPLCGFSLSLFCNYSEQTRCNPRGALVFLEQRRVRVEACGMFKPGEPRAELDGVTGRCDDSLSGKEVTRECSNQYPRTHAFHACSAFTDMS